MRHFLLFMFAALLAVLLMSCELQPQQPKLEAAVESKISDKNIPKVNDIRTIVLPTGERILVMTGPEGLATCCLLPPLKEAKVEK